MSSRLFSVVIQQIKLIVIRMNGNAKNTIRDLICPSVHTCWYMLSAISSPLAYQRISKQDMHSVCWPPKDFCAVGQA